MATKRASRTFWRRLKPASDALVGALAVGLLRAVRLAGPDRMANFAGWTLRKIGPLLREHRIGRENLTAAFPDKSPAEIDAILSGAWDNLGRMAVEFAHLDRLWDYDPDHPERSRITISDADIARFIKLRDDGKPALVFTAHLANWELPAVCAARYGLDSAALYRRPNIPAIQRWLDETRSANMGTMIATGLDAPVKIAQALERGVHVGMLVDQYFLRGVEVTFFGRPTMANPLIARLARHYDCPIHGTRIVRLPGGRFRAELTDEIVPPRDAEGRVDVEATMQAIMGVIEGWIREHPEQWLWQHRRWRNDKGWVAPTGQVHR